MRSINHRYADIAYSRISALAEANPKTAQEFGRLCHTFPSMVMLNGLRLTQVYFESKNVKGNAYDLYLRYLAEAIGSPTLKPPEPSTLYRDFTRRTLAASIWFKRYAEAVLNIHQADAQDEVDEMGEAEFR